MYISNTLRENHDELIQRWLNDLRGHVAEDYEQMLRTPMGNGVANKLLGLAIELLEAELHQEQALLHQARDAARDASYRRAAVGFGLTDIVTTAIIFRQALNETLMNHVSPCSKEEYETLLSAVLTLNRFCDAVVSGEIAGYFAYHDFSADAEEEAACA